MLSTIVIVLSHGFSDLIKDHWRWAIAHLGFIVAVGCWTGSIGTALAEVTKHQGWGSVLSGALGAAAAFGFDIIPRNPNRRELS